MNNVKDFNKVLEAKQLLIIIASMKGQGWRADQQAIAVTPFPGIDTVCGKEFLDELNKTTEPVLKKENRKIHKRVKVVAKECWVVIDTVEGLREEMYENFPVLDPNYIEPSSEEQGANKE